MTGLEFIVAVTAVWIGATIVAVCQLIWRDRNGHPKDERPVGGTSDERYAQQAQRQLVAKREALR